MKLNFIKQNPEVSGLFVFLTLFIGVLVLFVLLNFYVRINPEFFYIFLVIALLFFIIDPFLKANLPSTKANLLLLEIYIFVAHFTVLFSGKQSNQIFFFLYIIPIVSAAMSFGIRGSVTTTVIIFLLYNLNHENISKNILFYGPAIQQELPKFIAFLIIAIMLGFMSEENRKAEQRAYERMSKIVTLNEIKNSLKLDYDLNSILKISTNSIMKIMNCDAGAGLIYNTENNQVEDTYQNNIEPKYFSNVLLKITPEPELYKKTTNYIEDKKEIKKIKSLLRINLKIDSTRYLIIFISKTFQPKPFNVTDIDLLKTLKVYLELLLKNNFLYKQIENAKDYLYFSFKNLPTGIIILDNDKYIKFINTQALLLLKYDNDNDLLNKKLGSDIYLFQDKSIQNKIDNSENLMFQHTHLTSKNLEKKSIELTLTPLKTEYGLIKGMIIAFVDLTETKMLEEELIRRERLASLGQMSAGIAHELRNPLGAIEGFASLLKSDLQDNPELFKTASKIVDGVKDLNKIVTEFLNFTSKLQLEKKDYDIINTIEKSLLFLRKYFEDNNIKIEKNYCAKKIILFYDEDKIKQVLMNIFINAIDETIKTDNPKITINIKNKFSQLSKTDCMIVIEIFNTGKTIDNTEKQKIFNPFFTTKNNGVGLGLTISETIISEHNGRLYYQNRENGVSFITELPGDKRFIYS